jgi:RNA polymerase sigma-70 factor (ECF subfamily)
MEILALQAAAEGMEAPEESSRSLEAARAGDLSAFESLMRRHERLVLVTALRLLGNLADAQDVAQEVFLRLYRNLGKVEAAQNITGWLYKVTVNLCRDQYRRRPVTEELFDVASSAPTPHQELDAAERRRVLEMSLRRLPETERMALVLRDLEGLSTAEVAGILGVKEVTVRSQVSKARLKMKDFVERYFRRRP